MKQIGLYPNPQRDEQLAYTLKIADFLTAKGAEIFLLEEYSPYLSSCPKTITLCKEADFWEKIDVLITLGGDGTVLKAAPYAAKAGVPIFGINLGHVGFMTSLEIKEIEKIGDLLEKPMCRSQRMMLKASIPGKEDLFALNDFVFLPKEGFHMISLSLSVNGRTLSDYRADGMIFHTPTGSTGYSFSAGGALVEDSFPCIGIKPIAPYMHHNAQHMIFHPETVFSVKNCSCPEGQVHLCTDGKTSIALTEEDEIQITRWEHFVTLLHFSEKTNVEDYFRKF